MNVYLICLYQKLGHGFSIITGGYVIVLMTLPRTVIHNAAATPHKNAPWHNVSRNDNKAYQSNSLGFFETETQLIT
jgi:hypothetical protein